MRTTSILLTLLLLVSAACSSDDDGAAVTAGSAPECTPAEITAPAEGGTYTVSVKAESEWTAYADGDAKSWIAVKVSGSTSREGTVTLTVAANGGSAEREGIVVVSGGKDVVIPVRQAGVELPPVDDEGITAPEGYRLVWHDEFDKGSVPDIATWTHEVKPAGWVNDELQTYVSGQADGRRVTEIADGRLRINCFKGSDGKVYSGRIYANVSTGWQYGYIEASIRLPQGKGTWPAFWMMPVNFRSWPADGEIDIMEEVGVDANIVSSTIHCNKYNNGGTPTEHGSKYVATAETDFHVYACEWTDSFLKFFVDGELILSYRNDGTGYDAWPFDQPFYVILNLAWGGAWGGYKGVDDSALPVTMEVDYVRVFQKK